MSQKEAQKAYQNIVKDLISSLRDDSSLNQLLSPEQIDFFEKTWREKLEKSGVLKDERVDRSFAHFRPNDRSDIDVQNFYQYGKSNNYTNIADIDVGSHSYPR